MEFRKFMGECTILKQLGTFQPLNEKLLIYVTFMHTYLKLGEKNVVSLKNTIGYQNRT
jgi:hypothetical protein